eukprot:scaffold70140_cov18-Tisochrysis_lutea.AAC.1
MHVAFSECATWRWSRQCIFLPLSAWPGPGSIRTLLPLSAQPGPGHDECMLLPRTHAGGASAFVCKHHEQLSRIGGLHGQAQALIDVLHQVLEDYVGKQHSCNLLTTSLGSFRELRLSRVNAGPYSA